MSDSSSDEGDASWNPYRQAKKKKFPARSRKQPARKKKKGDEQSTSQLQPESSALSSSDNASQTSPTRPRRKRRPTEFEDNEPSTSKTAPAPLTEETSPHAFAKPPSNRRGSNDTTYVCESDYDPELDGDGDDYDGGDDDDEGDAKDDENKDVGDTPVVVIPVKSTFRPDDTFGMSEWLKPRVRFSFDMESYPRPGTRAYVNIEDGAEGRCERFFKFDRKNKKDQDVLKCLNCTRKRREDEKAGKVHLESTCQYAYVPVEGEENLYEFVQNPFERHGRRCSKDKITWGEVLVKFVMKNALYKYQQFPFGRPFDPFNRARLSIPDYWHSHFEHATEHDWMMWVPRWEQSSSWWYEARKKYLPLFDYDDISPAYAKTIFGRAEKSQWFGEDFIVEADEETGFLFAMSDYAAEQMLKCTHIICDGTFRAVKNVPKIKQTFTFHGRTKSGEVLPLAFSLLPGKTVEIYFRLFSLLREKLRAANGGEDGLGDLKVIMADWEATLDHPASLYFEELQRAYCSFHFSQSIIRHVGECGLIPAYRDGDPVVRRYIHCVLGSMLVPTPYMDRFCHMMSVTPDHKDPKIRAKLEAFVDYADKQYFRRKERRYMLNAFDNDVGWPRTSNSAEGFHSGLYEALRMHGSDLRRILYLFNEIEYNTHWRLYQLDNKKEPRYRKQIYKDLDKRIEIVKSQIIPLLDSIKDPTQQLTVLKKYTRYCSRLLGGAKHNALLGPMDEELVKSLIIDHEQPPARLLNMPNVEEVENWEEVEITPWSMVPFSDDDCNFGSDDSDEE